MPTYEYECAKCHRMFEQYQSITAEPLATCTYEGCDGPVKRLISAGAGFLFKGSGFYITDYRSDSYKKKAGADAGSAGAGTTPAPASSSSTSASSTPAPASSTPSTSPSSAPSSSSTSSTTKSA